MKKVLLFLFILSFIHVSCNQNQDKRREVAGNTQIAGTFENGKGKVITIGKLNNRQIKELAKDSITDQDFALGFDLEAPEVLYLQIPSDRTSLPVLVMPGDTIQVKIQQDLNHITFEKADPATVSFNGFILLLDSYRQKGKNLENQYRQASQQQNKQEMARLENEYNRLEEEKNQKIWEFLEKNSNNLASAIILEMLAGNPQSDFLKLKAVYDQLPEEVKKSSFAQNAYKNIQAGLVTAIGQKAPDFAAPTPKGDTLRMSDILKKSKVLVLDFWASWCRPCRVENPYVVEIYKKYHKDGLNILGISLDKPGDKEKWLKAIKDDQLDWYHVSNLQYWQDPVARQYGIMSIPSTLILDKNGVIRAKNLRREKLEQKIKELLNE